MHLILNSHDDDDNNKFMMISVLNS
jgi:hypothetical protein